MLTLMALTGLVFLTAGVLLAHYANRQYSDGVVHASAFVLFLAGFCVLLFTFIWWTHASVCRNKAVALAVGHRFEVMGGCMFQQGDRYVPESIFRVEE